MSNENNNSNPADGVKSTASQRPIDLNRVRLRTLILCKSKEKLEIASNYLVRRGWETTVTNNIKEAFKLVGIFKPDFVLISANLNTPRIEQLPALFESTFRIPILLYGESVDAKTNVIIREVETKYKLHGLASGPSFHRRIKNILNEAQNTQDAAVLKIIDRETNTHNLTQNEIDDKKNVKAKKGYTFTAEEQAETQTNPKRHYSESVENEAGSIIVVKGEKNEMLSVDDLEEITSRYEQGNEGNTKNSIKIKNPEEADEAQDLESFQNSDLLKENELSSATVASTLKNKENYTEGNKSPSYGKVNTRSSVANKTPEVTLAQSLEKKKNSFDQNKINLNTQEAVGSFEKTDTKNINKLTSGDLASLENKEREQNNKSSGSIASIASEETKGSPKIIQNASIEKNKLPESSSGVEALQKNSKADDNRFNGSLILENLNRELDPFEQFIIKTAHSSCDDPVEPLATITIAKECCVVPVSIKDVQKYIIIAHGGNREQGVKYNFRFRELLALGAKLNFVDIVVDKYVETYLDDVELDQKIDGELFSFKAKNGNAEVLIKVLDASVLLPTTAPTNEEDKLKISSSDLVSELSAGANIYFYMPKNQKYFLYFRDTSIVSEKQKDKIDKTQPQLFIKKDEIKKYEAVFKLNQTVKSLREIKKKKAA